MNTRHALLRIAHIEPVATSIFELSLRSRVLINVGGRVDNCVLWKKNETLSLPFELEI